MLGFFLLSSVGYVSGYIYEEEIIMGTFPQNFKWGTATAAYQIEGAWNVSGKGESIWDKFTHEGGHIDDNSSGDVACNSYYKYADDIQLMKDIGVSYYRMSIAWTRILPSGTGQINQAGIDYYNSVINEALSQGIQPAVTLYHWDLPQALQDQAGWQNSTVADWFEEYARVCFTNFGDRVKTWITLNEPAITATQGYGTGEMAPGINEIGTATYIAAHNQIRAHARAVKAYRDDFLAEQGGEIGITLSIAWKEPKNASDSTHLEASERAMEFDLGWYAHPILVDGKYPPIMRQKVDEKSTAQNFPSSRLPEFTAEESAMIQSSSDFLGINMYTSYLTSPKDEGIQDVSYFKDDDTVGELDPAWFTSGSSWLAVTPWGMRSLLNWTKQTYGDVKVYITENGVSDKQGNVDDLSRVYYYKHYINQILKAITIDNVNVQGYFAWSLLDNFEWARGYTERFGLHAVDFDDQERKRTQKVSAKYYSSIVKNNGFVPCERPQPSGSTTPAPAVTAVFLVMAAILYT